MVSNKVYKRLWDYGLIHQAGIISSISRGKMGCIGIEEVTEQTPNISEWLDFHLYYCGWCRNKNNSSTTDDKIIHGQWLGKSHKIQRDM